MVQVRQQYTSDLRQLAGMRAFAHEVFQREWDREVDEEALAQLEVALHEAALNIVLHAYKQEKGRPIELVIDADSREICVSLYHTGPDFDPEHAPPPVFDGSKESGFGVYLIKETVDEVRYFREDRGGRSCIRMVKKRP
jgi:anti-sigma regulatory factor (Ser/Thr protein kinase)